MPIRAAPLAPSTLRLRHASLAIGALQLMWDRGQTQDWFSSLEICVYATLCALSAWLFLVHITTTTRAPFITWRCSGTATSLPATFSSSPWAGAVRNPRAAPPLLQDLIGLPVVYTGLVTAPAGLGHASRRW